MATSSLTSHQWSTAVLASAQAQPRVNAVQDWLREWDRDHPMTVERHSLSRLRGWKRQEGQLRHRSGGFFSVAGLDVEIHGRREKYWQQPIILQPEVGLLGVAVTVDNDGVLRLLMQARTEPGNVGATSQVSPTVQATRSNYTRRHRGRSTPHLNLFRGEAATVVDVRQSEQGDWFLNKRNRNAIVSCSPGNTTGEGFAWWTLADIYAALRLPNMINMDARTVLSCLPLPAAVLREEPMPSTDLAAGLTLSLQGTATVTDDIRELQGWLARERDSHDVVASTVPLSPLAEWLDDGDVIRHGSGRHFEVTGVKVSCTGREVQTWHQPMIRPVAEGLAAILITQRNRGVELLVNATVQPGIIDGVQLGPTVHCTPTSLYAVGPHYWPPLFGEISTMLATGDGGRVHFDTCQSEEGGRFWEACVRYSVIEVDHFDPEPGLRWVTLAELQALAQHPYYLNVELRTLILALHSLLFVPGCHASAAAPIGVLTG